MHRLLVLYPPPADPDHFRSYYQDTHLPLVARLPGLRGYRFSFDVAGAEGEAPYFCVFEADRLDAKRRRRAQDERIKPLQAYRAEELSRCFECFFGPDRRYDDARRRFVYKLPEHRSLLRQAA